MKRLRIWQALVSTLVVATAAGQSCQQTGTVCISPGTASGPQMPLMTFNVSQSNCSSAQAAVQVSWISQYAAPKTPNGGYYRGTAGAFVSPVVYGNGTASIDWSENVYAPYVGADTFEGGTGTATVFISGYNPFTVDLSILGQNPSYALVAQAMQGMQAPWWYGKALSQESTTKQFVTYNQGGVNPVNYMPLLGPPDGFGIGQIDAATANPGSLMTDDTLWDWQNNLAEGIGLALSKQSPAYTYFASQISAAVAAGYPSSAFQSVEYGLCPVMYWTGSGQNGVQDAEWITSYNGGHYITFNTPLKFIPAGISPPITPVIHGGWRAPVTKYISAVCNAQTQTY